MTIGQLEDSRASLRLLIALHEVKEPLMLSDLYDLMHSRYALGRRTTETALETCIKLGLVKRRSERIGKNPMPSLFHSLTQKGEYISEIAEEIDEVLSEKPPGLANRIELLNRIRAIGKKKSS